jgi:hypothetical protein
MELSDVRGHTAGAPGVGSGVGRWVPLELARPWPLDDRAPASRSRGVREDQATAALELRHLMLLPPVEHAIERPTTKVSIGEVLTAWRAADRELNEILEDSPDWLRVHAKVTGLRAEYQGLFDERRGKRPGS